MINKKILTTIFAILLTATSVCASYFVQTPSPTTETITEIYTFDNYALAITSGANKMLFYNGSDWNLVGRPSSAYTYRNTQKASDGYFYALYSDGQNYEIYEFDNVSSWTLSTSGSTLTANSVYALGCKQDTGTGNADCFIVERNTTGYAFRMKKVLGSLPNGVYQSSPCTGGAVTKLTGGGTRLYGVCAQGTYPSANIVEYDVTGDSWSTSIATTTLTATWGAEFVSNSQRVALNKVFNSATGTYVTLSTAFSIYGIQIQKTNNLVFAVSADNKILYNTYYIDASTAFQTDVTASGRLFAIDCDHLSGRCWSGGENGLLYGTEATPIGGTTNTSASITITPNPTVYGQTTTISTSAHSTSGSPSTQHLICIGVSGDPCYYQYEINGVIPDQQTQTNTIDGIVWTNFQANTNYTALLNITFQDGTKTTANTTWRVITNATTNQTNYNATQYTTNATNLISVSTLGRNIGYAIYENNSDYIIASFDSTNPNQIIRNTKILNLTNTNPNTITSLKTSDTRIFLGTSDELYTLNNSDSGNANNLVQDLDGFNLGIGDYVYDVSAIDDEHAILCRKGILSDDAKILNYTTGTTDTISIDPCLSVEYANGLFIIHSGTNGIKIYNATNLSLVSTISVTAQPSGITHDRLSVYGSTLFAVTSTGAVSKYNITNPASPTKQAECRIPNYEVRSIEALSANEVIIGSTYDLRVCDVANQNFYQTAGYYTTTRLNTYPSGREPTEIERMDDNGKFHVAETSAYSVYFYTKADEEIGINNPPTINAITQVPASPCVAQTIYFSIEASDPENPLDLTYDYSCDLSKPIKTNNYLYSDFACSYSTSGSKTVKAWVEDSEGTEVVSTKTFTVNNCTAQNLIMLKILDGKSTNPVSGVTINPEGYTTTTTDQYGNAQITTTTANPVKITLSKTGYFTQSTTKYPADAIQTIYLEPTTDSTTGELITSLTVITQNSTGSLISGSLVSVTDPLSGQSKYAYTDESGTAVITPMFASSRAILSYSNEELGYVTTSEYISISNNQQKTITVTLLKEKPAYTANGRGCTDTIEGIVLCGHLNTTGLGSACGQDSDCITGRCEAGTGTRYCSNFNWTQCDDLGRPRDDACFRAVVGGRAVDNMTDGVLNNFLPIIVFIGILLVAVILINTARPKN